MTAKSFILVSLIFCKGLVFCQSNEKNCDFDRLKKDFKKSKTANVQADIALKIADCYRIANDTNYIEWYYTVIETHKLNSECDRSSRPRTKPIFQIAKSYYWLENYQQSAVWFEKVIMMEDDKNSETLNFKNQAIYYCGKSYYQLKDCNKATSFLTEYIKIEGDTLDIQYLIEKCK